MPRIEPTMRERTFGEDELLVSKTDLTGKITYANEVFLDVSGYTEEELVGAPHSLIRHPDMPRSVFKLAWDRIASGREIFAYVVNLAKSGDHYWVFAHITPTFADDGAIVGYRSNRRTPDRAAVAQIKPLYASLLAEETRCGSKEDGIRAANVLLERALGAAQKTYDELMFALSDSSHG